MPPTIPTPSSGSQSPALYPYSDHDRISSPHNESSLIEPSAPRSKNNDNLMTHPRSATHPSHHPDSDAKNKSTSKTTQTKKHQPPGGSISFTATSLEALRSLPEKRSLPWRVGHELVNESEIKRPQQKGALLLATRGVVQPKKCLSCEIGNGRFEVCVTLEGYFGGACASCVFPSKGSGCSFRKEREGREDDVDVKQEEGEELLKVVEQSRKRKRVSTTKALEASTEKKVKTSSQSKVARRQSQAQAQSQSQPQSQPQFEVQIPYERTRDHPEAVDLLNATYKKHKNDRNPSPPRGSVQSLSITDDSFSIHPHGQPKRPPTLQRHDDFSLNSASRTPLPTSQTPSATNSFTPVNALKKVNEKLQAQSGSGGGGGGGGGGGEKKEGGQRVPLIDTFSKSEQRQVYSLIHGLQGGIEGLHKQLGSLKAMLGIEEDT